MKVFVLIFIFLSIQTHAEIFDDPQNLKVFKKDISSNELRNGMKNFAMSLGVRCSHCHVGEEGKPLTTYDFASDDKQNKKTARLMMKMVKKMNLTYITKVEDHSIKVECMTCHRGQSTPQLTNNLLINDFNTNDIDSTIKKYNGLKQQYYGSHTHDFSEGMLLTVASNIAKKDSDSAIKILNKNLESFPKGLQTLFTLGQTYQSLNEIEKAINYYQKANKISPNPRLEKMIEKLKSQ